jgi:Rrf2 family protein
MNLLPRRSLLAIAAVVDIAYHARPAPIAAKALSARHSLPPRHLETLLQVLVRSGILKGVRGPRGGYELARERRRITLADIVRAASASAPADDGMKDGGDGGEPSALVRDVVVPAIDQASEIFLEKLQEITVDDLCRDAQSRLVFGEAAPTYDFNI